jgi:uncharacterized protein YbcI
MSEEVESRGELLAEISNSIVGILADYYGRGPTKAKTYAFDNYVVTVLQDILTTVEHTLVEHGHKDLVRQVRITFQEAVADRFTDAVEAATGRKVLAYHSQVTFDPATGIEFFVLEPDAEEE